MSEPANLKNIMGDNDTLTGLINRVKRLTVVVFHATWCGPCKKLGEVIPVIATENPDVIFLRVDIDQNKELASYYHVSGVPAVHFFKPTPDGRINKLGEVGGFDPAGIRNKVRELK